MDPHRSIARPGTWEEMRAAFRWSLPDRFNIAEAICERWARAQPGRRAMIYLRPDGEVREYSYIQLSRASSRLANAFREHGLARGGRCAVLLPQTPETTLTHLACYKLGAIVVPLFTLFGEDGLEYRLRHSGAHTLVTDSANLPKILAIRDRLPDLRAIFSIDAREAGTHGFWQELGKAVDTIEMARTGPDDPAFISYTSGTTGPPKGALHGHRVLIGHLPGIETHHNFLPQAGDCLWTPADWAWMGGLANVMMPALYYGVPLVAHRMSRFDPERAFDLMARLGVRNSFLPPTALKLMRQSGVQPKGLDLRSVGSGGEALGAELLDWGRDVLGVTINEFYGQTECNLVLGNCAQVMQARPGSTGKPVPGHEVAIIDTDGNALPEGSEGEIAVRRPDPAMFLEYWQAPEKTAEKFVGDWMRTGDVGRMDGDGYVFFAARSDDVITTSGYRVGPTEIEDCLTGHPDVTMAAVIGVPDPVRTEAIRAYVVPTGAPGPNLEAELIARVRTRLSPHVAPREVVFVDELPMTATGKVMRRSLKDRALQDMQAGG
ncbi:AMP-binding protein [Oceanomicrobium pacificus]|uniref:AMP-binding protein n=1 Tax=Oceanomicrobium pacificus TaxID=2692916 RepID=A0A6B0TZW1_9RHOB|nr:AMP-binding protein [Oceanomicrobium pacificus]MXU66524.1 AMP-binding protein [Oceanomicrobium pacificus]